MGKDFCDHALESKDACLAGLCLKLAPQLKCAAQEWHI